MQIPTKIKAVILAGGMGTRISEESSVRPKPMIEIGGKPILWHIMKTYSHHGIHDFVICLGYKGYVIKEYFSNYFLHSSDVTFDMRSNRMEVHHKHAEPWRVTLVDTGEKSMTGGRLKRVKPYVENDELFCLTYGDGVSDVDIGKLIEFHRAHGKAATLTGVQPPGRFGALGMDGTAVTSFQEKPNGDGSWINGGFFVFEPAVFDYLVDDQEPLEGAPLSQLAQDGELMAFRHYGFWHPMDTVRDRNALNEVCHQDPPPWLMFDEASQAPNPARPVAVI